jgi:Concanavalin A-like lectin/glucanases superfamily
MPGCTRRPERGARRLLAGGMVPVLVAGVMAAAIPAGAQAADAQARGAASVDGQDRGPAPLSAFAASERAKKTGKPVVASALTTATSLTTAKPGGTFTVTESLVPVRAFRDGKWQGLNPVLHRNADRTVSPGVTADGLVLSGGGNGPLAVLSSHGRSMSLWWPGRLPVPALSGATATYPNVLPGVDLAVTADAQGGLSDVLVVTDAAAAADPALASLRLRVAAPGLKVTASGAGDLRVATSATAEPVFSAAAPQMWDSARPAPGSVVTTPDGTHVTKPSGAAAYSSAAGPGAAARVWRVPLSVSGTTITLTPPRTALTARGNVYPLYIDPSFEPDPVNEDNTAWTEVDSGLPDNSGDWGESSYLQVGLCDWSYCNGIGVARSFFTLPMPSQLTSSTSINSADIYTTENWSASCTPETVELRPTGPINSPDSSSPTTWDNQPSWSSTTLSQSVAFGYDSSCPYSANDVTWNVTSEIAGDAGHVSSQTWGLMAGDESGSGADLYWKQFNSGASAITMSVSYHNPPDTPTALANAPGGACVTSYASEPTIGANDLTLSATAGDVDNLNGDDSLTTTFTVKSYSTNDTVDTIKVASGNATGGVLVSTSAIPRATVETWGADGSTTSYSYYWYATTSDAGSPVLTSPQSETCYFLYNPLGPAAPGVTESSTTVTIGTSFSATFVPPAGCSTSASPCPVSFTYQLGVSAPVTVTPNNNPATGDWTGNITMTQISPVQLTVYGTSSGGNPGTTYSTEMSGAPPSPPYPDGYFTGGSYPSLLTTGTGADPSLWLSAGTGNGTLASPTDIGSLGTGINPGTDGPGDWKGAQVLHGRFSPSGVEDVMAYYPTGNDAGNGTIIAGTGDASPLRPASGNLWNISSDGPLTDPDYGNPDNPVVPSVLVAAGDASEQATGLDDLIGILGTSPSDGGTGYELDLFSATTTGQYGFTQMLSAQAPDGTADWNNYALATAQPGGSTNPDATPGDMVALFALDKATGALYESVNPTCDPGDIAGCEEGPSSTLIGTTGSTWTTISTPWGTTAPGSLVSADVNNAGTIELWTLSDGTTTPYTLSGTTLTQENAGTSLSYPDNDWQLNDGSSDAQGSTATTATDSITGDTATITGNCTGSCFWTGDDFFGTVADTASQPSSSGKISYSYVAASSGVIPATAVGASISVWFNTTTPDGVLVSYDGSPPSAATVSSDYEPVLYVGTDGKLQADMWPAGHLSSTAQVDDGLWHHAVLTDNGTTETLTLDGVTQGTSAGTPNFSWATPGYLDFGAGYLGGSWPDEPDYSTTSDTGYLTNYSGKLADVQVSGITAATADVFWQGPGSSYSLEQARGQVTGSLTGPADDGMGALGSAPAAGADANGNIYVYWRGTDDNLWEAYWNGSAWLGPYNRGMGALGSQPSVAISSNGTAYVFWKGTDGNLWEAEGPADGALSGPTDQGLGTLGSAPAAGVDANGVTYVYWEGTDGNLWEGYWNGTGWTDADRGMGTLGSQPTVAITGNGTAYVFWEGSNGDLLEAQGPAGAALTGPTDLGLGPLGSPPAAGLDINGLPYVYWEGTSPSCDLIEAYWNGTGWAGPFDRGLGPLSSQPAVAIYPS